MVPTLEEQLFEILRKCEASIKELAVANDNYPDYYEDEASDALDLCQSEIHDTLLSKVPEFITNGAGIDSLPQLARASDIFEFCEALSPHEKEFPYLFDYAETFDDTLISWEPLHSAVRDFFTLARITDIASQSEVDLALIGFEQISKIDQDLTINLDKNALLEKLELLRKSTYLTYEQVVTVNELIETVQEMNIPHTPIIKNFEGSSGGLEPIFLEWIEKTFKIPLLLMDDDIDELEDEPDPNLELLKERWLERGFAEKTSYEGFIWEPIAVNATVDIELEEKPIYVVLNQLSQITQDRILIPESAEPQTMDKYKLTLYRTGERHEYDSEMDKYLLALQTLIVLQNLNVPVENIESEIDWVRLGEKSYPLLGLSEDELDSLSKIYLDAQ
jgi:hypothetical protein